MKPSQHAAISVGIGAGVWAATGSPMAIPVAVGSGVLIDADHLLDFYNWYVRGNTRHLLIPLHAWELSVLGAIILLSVWYHPLFLAAVLGYLGHLVADQFGNSLHPMAYSFFYRLYRGFDRIRLMGQQPIVSISEVLRANIPFWGKFEPWITRVASKIRN